MPIPIEVLNLKNLNKNDTLILCRVHIKRKEYRFLIDTGSSITVFNIDKIKELTCDEVETDGQIISTIGNNEVHLKYVILENITIGEVSIDDYKMNLMSVDNLNYYFKNNNLPMIDGILGGDILFKYKAIIDYDKREILLNPYNKSM